MLCSTQRQPGGVDDRRHRGGQVADEPVADLEPHVVAVDPAVEHLGRGQLGQARQLARTARARRRRGPRRRPRRRSIWSTLKSMVGPRRGRGSAGSPSGAADDRAASRPSPTRAASTGAHAGDGGQLVVRRGPRPRRSPRAAGRRPAPSGSTRAARACSSRQACRAASAAAAPAAVAGGQHGPLVGEPCPPVAPGAPSRGLGRCAAGRSARPASQGRQPALGRLGRRTCARRPRCSAARPRPGSSPRTAAAPPPSRWPWRAGVGDGDEPVLQARPGGRPATPAPSPRGTWRS